MCIKAYNIYYAKRATWNGISLNSKTRMETSGKNDDEWSSGDGDDEKRKIYDNLNNNLQKASPNRNVKKDLDAIENDQNFEHDKKVCNIIVEFKE